MESAFDGYVGLDREARAWEMRGMERVRGVARGWRGLGGSEVRAPRESRAWRKRRGGAGGRAQGFAAARPLLRPRGLGLLALLVLAAAAASAACHGPHAEAGVGGQSGDEGRRPGTTWLGTGGVAATSARP